MVGSLLGVNNPSRVGSMLLNSRATYLHLTSSSLCWFAQRADNQVHDGSMSSGAMGPKTFISGMVLTSLHLPCLT